MKHKYHSRKVRQLDRLIKEMKQAMRARQPKALVDRIGQKIAVLIKDLRGVLSGRQLAHKLGALAIVFGFTSNANAQQFDPIQVNPFGFVTDSLVDIADIGVADLDGDGDVDVLIGGYNGSINYHENTGTASAPAFGPAQNNPFGLTGANTYLFISTADLDDDGDIDILIGEYYGALQYYENTGDATTPSFAAPTSNPFGLTASTLLHMPNFVDLDDDGDFDLLSCSIAYAGGPEMLYFENTGTASSPSFAAPTSNPFGITLNPGYFSNPTTADLDGDGDIDLLVGESYGVLTFFENTGTASAPAFGAPQSNPFGLNANGIEFVFPEFVDTDDDGDMDILASGYYGALMYFENSDPFTGVDELANNVAIGPNPFSNEVTFTADANLDLVEVLDMTGKLVYSEVNPDGQIQLDHLKKGVYMIQVVDSEGQISREKLEKL